MLCAEECQEGRRSGSPQVCYFPSVLCCHAGTIGASLFDSLAAGEMIVGPKRVLFMVRPKCCIAPCCSASACKISPSEYAHNDRICM